MPTFMRNRKRHFAFTILAFLAVVLTAMQTPVALAQSESASVSGRVTDQQNAVIPNVEIEIRNVDTNSTQITKTNGDGIYTFASLRPGNYVMSVRKEQFQTVSVTGITLHVQDDLSRNFTLQVGSSAVSVTVEANGINMNTTDGAVSTIVDRKFVENMPLNGRSFQSLLTLAPGVAVVPTAASGAGVGVSGEITVNGQRTEANYFTVDGVSANTGNAPGDFGLGAGYAGSVPGETTLGTTQSLVSLDALQEFRATTSTYSAENGRTPGGQFAFTTRSGTNDWHGSAYDYLRNDALDANNWFNNFYDLPKGTERQNDFGGTLGGPVRIPALYNGKDKTFFFFSYEGLRLLVPEGVAQYSVPDATLRQNAPSALQPILNGFPLPNGGESGLNNGQAIYNQSISNPSSLDSFSVRVDHNFSEGFRIFGRFANTSSASSTYSSFAGGKGTTNGSVRTLTVGATNAITATMSNDLRFNITQNSGSAVLGNTNLSGAIPLKLTDISGINGAGLPDPGSALTVCLCFGQFATFNLDNQSSAQRQYNVTDTYGWIAGRHSLKFGVDWRRLSTYSTPLLIQEYVEYDSEQSVLANTADFGLIFSKTAAPVEPVYKNFSLFAQDEWKVNGRLSLSLGLRWDVNPAPGNLTGPSPYTLDQINNLASAQLARAGTPLWATDLHSFAPRFGVAYQLRQAPGHETVVRGGFGVFYDMGNAQGSSGFGGIGFSQFAFYSGVSFPFTSAQLTFPPMNLTPPYNNFIYAFDPNLRLPYTLQWNVAVQQALGKKQSLTVGYVGSGGRRLLTTFEYYPENLGNPNFSSQACGGCLYITKNGATSDYNALQAQFQRSLSDGLQILASYTFSHSIDQASSNFQLRELFRASSDFDIRHNFQLALTYDIPGRYSNRILSALLMHWGVDTRISARSALPVDIVGTQSRNPGTQTFQAFHPDLVPGQPLYLYGSGYPGGKVLNYNAFQVAPTGVEGDVGRNFARGFGAEQVDLALRREFPIHERLRLQFRAEAFNALNHPNFDGITNQLSNGPYDPATGNGFGGAATTLNHTLSGLNSLYQIGGPRSLQVALKLQF